MVRLLSLLLFLGLVAAIVWVATTKGFPWTHRAVTGVLHEGLGLSQDAAAVVTNGVRKAFHLAIYALVAVLLRRSLPRSLRHAPVVLGLVLLVAVVDECVQVGAPLRSGSPWDVALDLLGAYLGIRLAARWEARVAGRT